MTTFDSPYRPNYITELTLVFPTLVSGGEMLLSVELSDSATLAIIELDDSVSALDFAVAGYANSVDDLSLADDIDDAAETDFINAGYPTFYSLYLLGIAGMEATGILDNTQATNAYNWIVANII